MMEDALKIITEIIVHILLKKYLPADILNCIRLAKCLVPILPLPVRKSLATFLFCFQLRFPVLFSLSVFLFRIICL